MADRSGDWFRHQAAEKAVRALHLKVGQEAWGHVLTKLLQELPVAVNVPEDLLESGRLLVQSEHSSVALDPP